MINHHNPFVAPALAALLALPLLGCPREEVEEIPVDTPPAAAEEVTRISVDDLALAIERHVEEAALETDGYYEIHDPVTDETLRLELERVHRERLSRVGPDTYFACADFVAEDGTVYDLDIFMRGETAEQLEFTEVSIHKVDDEARYTWARINGTWEKVPVDEHPDEEHPEEEHPEEEEHPTENDEEHPN